MGVRSRVRVCLIVAGRGVIGISFFCVRLKSYIVLNGKFGVDIRSYGQGKTKDVHDVFQVLFENTETHSYFASGFSVISFYVIYSHISDCC